MLRAVVFFTLMHATACFAESLHLVCTGWIPYYQTYFSAPTNLPPGSTRDTFTMDLDLKKGTIFVPTVIGYFTVPLETDDTFYSGKVPIPRNSPGAAAKTLSVSINRLTGETVILYQATQADSWVGFVGTCDPAMQKF